ncbi:MAG: coproporphyrinogen III oxidase family protein [Alphaproteobacteria bacterium]|nr:coproporphyrinogen III oxidase family protein [Alphaproteobacteria bacterium]
MIPAHHLYIHVPFCVKKCPYCAFHSTVGAPDWSAYAANIINAIKQQPKCRIPTIFFGGGTPSLMPAKILSDILDAARSHFDVAGDAEITIEMNPGTAFQDYKSIGVTRISVGAQSFDDKELEFLGRIHSAAEARRTIDAALNAGFDTSADFIYALPGQTTQDVAQLCAEIKRIGLKHASLYELTPEANAKFAPCEQNTEMFVEIGRRLRRYEVSNYAEPGHECRHNFGIWAGEPYIGLGPSAAGRLFDGTNWLEQSSGITKPLTARDRAIEKVITGLRTTRGVKLTNDVKEILNWNFIEKNPILFLQKRDSLVLNKQGLLILDGLLPKVIL